jgi:hypothetical protein
MPWVELSIQDPAILVGFKEHNWRLVSWCKMLAMSYNADYGKM